jgi:hypothetical protein
MLGARCGIRGRRSHGPWSAPRRAECSAHPMCRGPSYIARGSPAATKPGANDARPPATSARHGETVARSVGSRAEQNPGEATLPGGGPAHSRPTSSRDVGGFRPSTGAVRDTAHLVRWLGGRSAGPAPPGGTPAPVVGDDAGVRDTAGLPALTNEAVKRTPNLAPLCGFATLRSATPLASSSPMRRSHDDRGYARAACASAVYARTT